MLQAACSGHKALQRCSGLRSDWRRNVFYKEIRNQIFSKYWRVRGTGQTWSLHWSVGGRYTTDLGTFYFLLLSFEYPYVKLTFSFPELISSQHSENLKTKPV